MMDDMNKQGLIDYFRTKNGAPQQPQALGASGDSGKEAMARSMMGNVLGGPQAKNAFQAGDQIARAALLQSMLKRAQAEKTAPALPNVPGTLVQ
ncbi:MULTISPECIES: hypothetical protein [Rhodomicrobium]|uniref:hypothetical protein n=1 Tax=Rhodomicrobium TaxID=1068 RepID=UPI000F74AACB|nr:MULTISPECIES: hypothetical protein [Rhodomicrobium]